MSESAFSYVERQQGILDYVEQHHRVTTTELCRRFDISLATARRDLEALAERGVVQRVHGGAIAVRIAPPELPVLQRTADRADQKQRIGKAAAALIADGDTVFISSGTTALAVARSLRQRRNLTIISNSLLVINDLATNPDITVIGLGGMLRNSELSLIGNFTEQALAELRTDKVIFGIRAIDLNHGLSNDFVPETMTDRAILRIAPQVIVVADHTKLDRVSTVAVASLSAMQTLVTDTQAPAAFVDALRERGIQVITS